MKSNRERQIPHDIIYTWKLKKKKKTQMNLYTKQKTNLRFPKGKWERIN